MALIDLKGMGIALVTPFKADGSVDYEALVKLVEYQVQNGTDYLVVLGTTAETPTLTETEKAEIKRLVVTQVRRRVPVVLGVGGNCTRAVVDTLRQADLQDVDAILSVVPYYNKPSQEGMYRHFAHLAEASPLPLVLYNVPGRVGVNMAPDTVVRLARDFDNIIGIKEASGYPQQAAQITACELPEDFVVLSGDDALTVPFIQNGAVGVISVVGNAYPRLFSHLTHLAMEGHINEADMIQTEMRAINTQLFQEGNPVGIKALLYLMRLIDSNSLRLPLVAASPELSERLDATRKALDIYASHLFA